MATTEAVPTPVENDSSANITTESVVYRTYGAYNADSQAVGVKGKNADGSLIYKDKPSVQAESNDKKNWTLQEANGATILVENSYKFYKLTGLAGFGDLVPDDEQKLYIINKGLAAIQTSAANSMNVEVEKKNSKDDPDVFVYNGVTIDLLEAINEPPQRKNLTDEQKFLKAVSVLKDDPAKLTNMIAQLEALKAQLAAQS